MKKKDYILMTDSHCDLTPEEIDNNIFVIPMPYSLKGEEVFGIFNNKKREKFYEDMKCGGIYTTAALPPVYYESVFSRIFKEGLDIVYVHVSSKMTSTIRNAEIAAEGLRKNFPNRQVYFVDSMATTSQMYRIVLDIIDLSKNISSAEQLISSVYEKNIIGKYKTYFTVENLDYLARSGRVSNIKNFITKTLNIFPLLTFQNGEIVAIKKVLGRNRVLKEIADRSLQEGDSNLKLTYIKSGDWVFDTDYARRTELAKENIRIVNPTTGVHCGPGAFGITFPLKED